MNALNKIIRKTALYTLMWAFIVFAYGIAVFGYIRPQQMAGFADSIGAKGMSAMYWNRVYNNDKTPENLYTMIDKYMIAENNDKIIKYMPDLINMTDRNKYYELIDAVNDFKFNQASGFSSEVRALVSNEDNRLKCAYVMALQAEGKTVEVKAAVSSILDVNNIRLDSPSTVYFVLNDTSYLAAFTEYFNAYKTAYGEEEPVQGDRESLVGYYYIQRYGEFL